MSPPLPAAAPAAPGTLRALALANAGAAVGALAAHVGEAEDYDVEEVAEQLLVAGAYVLAARGAGADARIVAEIERWRALADETRPAQPPAAQPAAIRPIAEPPTPVDPSPATWGWRWHLDDGGDLALRDGAGAPVAEIRCYRVTVRQAADPEAGEPYAGVWTAAVRNATAGLPDWRLVGTSLDDAYARVEAAIGRPTTRWHHPETEEHAP